MQVLLQHVSQNKLSNTHNQITRVSEICKYSIRTLRLTLKKQACSFGILRNTFRTPLTHLAYTALWRVEELDRPNSMVMEPGMKMKTQKNNNNNNKKRKYSGNHKQVIQKDINNNTRQIWLTGIAKKGVDQAVEPVDQTNWHCRDHCVIQQTKAFENPITLHTE